VPTATKPGILALHSESERLGAENHDHQCRKSGEIVRIYAGEAIDDVFPVFLLRVETKFILVDVSDDKTGEDKKEIYAEPAS